MSRRIDIKLRPAGHETPDPTPLEAAVSTKRTRVRDFLSQYIRGMEPDERALIYDEAVEYLAELEPDEAALSRYQLEDLADTLRPVAEKDPEPQPATPAAQDKPATTPPPSDPA